MISQGRLSSETGGLLLESAFNLAEAKANRIIQEIYAPWKDVVLLRIPRDSNDWPTVALALAIDAAIWTSDADFLDCRIWRFYN